MLKTQHGFVIVALILVLLIVVSGCGATPTPFTNTRGTPLPPLPTLDPAQIRQGQQVYQVQCASCHGAKAEGAAGWQKPDAQGNFPPPPHDDSGHTWHHPDRVLYEAIRDGMADPLRPNSPLRMPAFGDKPALSGAEGLSDADIHAVIMYFKSLWSAEHRAFQSELTREDLMQTPKAPTPGR